MLRVKRIPPRPAEFDGKLCLFGLMSGVDEAQIRSVLGDVEICQLKSDVTVVRFATHEEALAAKKDEAWSALSEGADTQYNEHPYDLRGW